MNHFLQETDFTPSEMPALLATAQAFKRGRAGGLPQILAGQTWALLFTKSSTRTRVSFEVGIHELGGKALYLDQSSTQMGRGESLEDTARVLSRYVHGLVVRCHGHEMIESLAQHATVPVVNALTDRLHPCQVYTDAFTLAERWIAPGEADLARALRGRKIAFFGDCASNMAHSWILGAAHFGMEIRLAGPSEYAPHPVVDALLRAAGLPVSYQFTTDAEQAAQGADVLYTDVFVSMGQESESEKRLAQLAPYMVTPRLLAVAAPGACFMHCLPAHPGQEVDPDLYRSPASIVYEQAGNRLPVQQAILSHLLRRHREP